MTTWGELLGDESVPSEQEERAGSSGGSAIRSEEPPGAHRQLAAAAFDPADEEAWERLEEALIAADVGVPATAELVGGSRRATTAEELTRRSRRRCRRCWASPGRSTR